MTQTPMQFLIIDDDQTNNFLSKMTIKKSFGEAEIIEFTDPEVALEYIGTQFVKEPHTRKTILFLDINMPILTGWEFLEKFETFAETIKMQFDIYILSSSIDHSDIQLAEQNSLVIDFIEKPLSKTILGKIFA
jgi:response regulator RpfG family c-di-GMP phosphodiesterase